MLSRLRVVRERVNGHQQLVGAEQDVEDAHGGAWQVQGGTPLSREDAPVSMPRMAGRLPILVA